MAYSSAAREHYLSVKREQRLELYEMALANIALPRFVVRNNGEIERL